MCSESANSAKSAAVSCIMSIYRVKCSSPNVEESEKLILDPHSDPDHHLNLNTSSGSPIAHVYRVWSTSVNAFVSCPAYRQRDRPTDTQTDKTNNRQTARIT